jgi:hypothetical protein
MTCRLRTEPNEGPSSSSRDGVCSSEAAAMRILGQTRLHHREVEEEDAQYMPPPGLRRENGVRGSREDDPCAKLNADLRRGHGDR